jgi:hypothetical protein
MVEFRISQQDLVVAFSRAVNFMDTESTRYCLGGVLLESDGEKLYVVATNGRAMVVDTISVALPVFSLIIDAKTAKRIASCVMCQYQIVFAQITEATFKAIIHTGYKGKDPKEINGEIVQGRFPDWRQIANKKVKEAGTVEGKEKLFSKLFEPKTGTRISLNGSVKTAGVDWLDLSRGLEWTGDCEVQLNDEYVRGWLSSNEESEANVLMTINDYDECCTLEKGSLLHKSRLFVMPMADRR